MQNCKLERLAQVALLTLVSVDETDDKICIFELSRGAYTLHARSLACKLVISLACYTCRVHKVGIIPRSTISKSLLHTACTAVIARSKVLHSRRLSLSTCEYRIYRCLVCSCDAFVEFVCDRDTVSSVGYIPKQLPFTHGNNSIKVFRHALSLDVRRVYVPQNSLRRSFLDLQWSGTSKFKQCTWKRPNDKDGFRVKPDRMSLRFLRHFLKCQDNIESNRSHHPEQCQPSLEHEQLTDFSVYTRWERQLDSTCDAGIGRWR